MNSTEAISQTSKKRKFFSLRWRLLIGFTLVFSAVFTGSYYWFYAFSTDKAIDRLKQDLKSTVLGAAEGVDVEELMELYQEGKPNAKGFSDDPRYRHQLEWFKTVHNISPNVYPYSYVVGEQQKNRRIGESAVKPKDLEIIYLVDSLWLFIPDRALKFLQSGKPSEASRRTFEEGITVERDFYTDEWGSWISAYTPLKDDSGKIVGVLGADIEASYVNEVQKEIRDSVGIAFGLTYGTLFILVYIVSGIFTKPLNKLTAAAAHVGEGDYSQDFSELQQSKLQDEISTMAQVFEMMVDKVRHREESLKQQVAELKIEIDQTKRKKQVSEIVDSDFFQDLVVKARKMRNQATNIDTVSGSANASTIEQPT